MKACIGWLVVGVALGVNGDLEPFAPPWDDGSPGPTSLAATLQRPAGALGSVKAQGGHLVVGGTRLRLFGVNLTAGACYPDRPTAERVAARMAKFGLNAVRLHFLDADWGSPRLLESDPATGGSRWNEAALERLDYFVGRLREHGLYININLLVGRRFGAADGVDESIRRLDWKAAHAVGFFHAPHLDAQKAYARRLLTHRNPHTGLTYAEDPAVALVEINNENGLIHAWMDGAFDALPEPFARDFQTQWSRWLAARYPNSEALSRAWGARDQPLEAELLSNASLADGLSGWSLEQHQGAKVTSRTEGGVAFLQVVAPGSEAWHVQLNQPRLKIAKGRIYTASFRAAADRPRKAVVHVMQAHEPWKSLGLLESVSVGPDWTPFSFSFVADEQDVDARFGFSGLGQEGAAFRFADLSLRPGGRLGLAQDESLERQSIRLPGRAAWRRAPEGARRDWIQFLWETERAYWVGMQRFLKDELGVKGLIAGSIVGTSTPHLMADLDVVDTHAYWQHPRFPGKPWDRSHWSVGNLSMVDFLNEATVTRLALRRVEGKPHMVSEYNHPAPNPHAGEGPLFLAAMAGLQDWDALFLYTYSHDDAKTKAGRIPDFFDVGQHPTVMTNAVVASLLFRRGDVSPGRELLVLPLSAEREIELVASKGTAWNVAPVDRLGLDPKNALRSRVAIRRAAAEASPPPLSPGAASATDVASDTGELSWSSPAGSGGLLELRTSRTKAVWGRVDGRRVDLGDGVVVQPDKTLTGWCTVALTLLEGESFRGPGRGLLVATGYTENTDMGWKDAKKSTVGKDWGKAPSLVEVVGARVCLPRRPGGPAPVIHALDERGQRTRVLEADETDGTCVVVRIGRPHKTLWYEIELR